MQQDNILAMMKAYFAEVHEPEELRDFAAVRAGDLIEDSVDAVTFIMHIEDKLARHIPMAQASGLTGMTFDELASKLAAGELGVAPPRPAVG
jgi:acyl carrier protein